MHQVYFPYVKLLKGLGLSERELATVCGVSRGTLRKINSRHQNLNLTALDRIAAGMGCYLDIVIGPKSSSEYSVVAVSANVLRDGFDSWTIHFMDFVDEFRRCTDPRLILLEPLIALDSKLYALLAAITSHLCHEADINIPNWALKKYFLPQPWFPSSVESLKAFALLESPFEFRANNIFVLENFLSRT